MNIPLSFAFFALVKFIIKDDKGNIINTFESDEKTDTINAYWYFLKEWMD